MNGAADLLALVHGRGITLTPEGDDLRVRTPKGALTADLRAALAARKPELLALLRAESSPAILPVSPPPLYWRRMVESWGPDDEWWRRWRRRADELLAALGDAPGPEAVDAAEARAASEVLAAMDTVDRREWQRRFDTDPELQRIALEYRARPAKAAPPAPPPADEARALGLVGPRRTPWGTRAYSAPGAMPIGAFGPAPAGAGVQRATSISEAAHA